MFASIAAPIISKSTALIKKVTPIVVKSLTTTTT